MATTDPIADMLTRIRNALMVRHETVDVPASRMKVAIARVLKDEGFIRNYKFLKDNKQGILKIFLKYADENPVIGGLERVSRPGRRMYSPSEKIPRVKRGLGCMVLSTSKGIMTDQKARKENIGGELMFRIW